MSQQNITEEATHTPQLQISTATSFGRHQHEFRLISRGMPKGSVRRILSFGCSNGMEARTLARFFEGAEIVGVDINDAALDEARRVNGKYATFYKSDRLLLSQLGQFDLVTCNSVFCRFPTQVRDGRPIGIEYDVWCETLSLVLSLVRPGGFLQLFNSNFPFRFHPEYKDFHPVRDPVLNEASFVDLFTPDGDLMASGNNRLTPLAAGFSWYSAGPEVSALAPWDLHDQIFQKNGSGAIERFSVDAPEIVPEECELWSTMSSRHNPAASRRVNVPVTSVAADIDYGVRGGKTLIMKRTLRRIWFDGSEPIVLTARMEMPEFEARSMLKIPRVHEDIPDGRLVTA